MAQAMKGVTRAMQNMNRQMNLPQIQKIMQEFEKQSEIMEMKEEIINDTMDDAMEGDDDEEETYEFFCLTVRTISLVYSPWPLMVM